MKRVYLLVEGQTEETFVRELLAPHYVRMEMYLIPIIVSTRPGYRGGITSYAKVRPQIERLCKQDTEAVVSTLFDLYGLPEDFPGKRTTEWMQQYNGLDKALLIEHALAADILQTNFLPYIQVHEFEALLFTNVSAFEVWTNDDRVLAPLRAVSATTAPEDINDNPQTAPSKRILSAMRDYQKPVHGPLIACDIGLDAMRAACPHFAQWLGQLDALAFSRE
jgi:hypothetical protein